MIFLSSPYAERYRIFQYIIAVLLMIGIGLFLLFDISTGSTRLLSVINIGIIAYLLFKRAALLKTVSYDSHHLYIREKQQEEIIPLKAIRKVELKTLGGRWEISFHPAYTNREIVMFIPSLLYPLNYKKIESKIEQFHQVIAEARKSTENAAGAFPGLASTAHSRT